MCVCARACVRACARVCAGSRATAKLAWRCAAAQRREGRDPAAAGARHAGGARTRTVVAQPQQWKRNGNASDGWRGGGADLHHALELVEPEQPQLVVLRRRHDAAAPAAAPARRVPARGPLGSVDALEGLGQALAAPGHRLPPRRRQLVRPRLGFVCPKRSGPGGT